VAHSSREYQRNFMRKQREQERVEVGRNKSKIEEMTWASFGDMEHSWCMDATARSFRVENPNWTEEQVQEEAKKHCDGCREEVRAIIATDLDDKAKREAKTEIIEKVNAQVSSAISPFSDEMRQNYEGTVNFCIKKRSFYLGSLYNPEAIEQYCRELLPKVDSVVMGSIVRQQMREAGKYTCGDVSQEYADRVYSLQAILNVPQASVERYVKADMVGEGKFADITKRTYSRESVGNLFGKTRAEILAMDSTKKSGRATVGDLYGKSRKEIIDSGGEH
jgi:hypothetical protein